MNDLSAPFPVGALVFAAAALTYVLYQRRARMLAEGERKRRLDNTASTGPDFEATALRDIDLRWRGDQLPRPLSARSPMHQQVHVPAGLLAKLGRQASPAPFAVEGAYGGGPHEQGQAGQAMAGYATAMGHQQQGTAGMYGGQYGGSPALQAPWATPGKPGGEPQQWAMDATQAGWQHQQQGQPWDRSLQQGQQQAGPAAQEHVEAPIPLGQLRYVEIRLGTPLWGGPHGTSGAGGQQRQPHTPLALVSPPRVSSTAAVDAIGRTPVAARDASPAPGRHLTPSSSQAPVSARTPAVSRLPVADFEISWDELQLLEVIGQGAFGRVYRARWRGSVVAVKTVIAPPTASLVEDFKAEVAVISALRHPNVLLFMAACTSPSHLALVTELAPQGSLWDLIHTVAEPLAYTRVLDVGLGIARGMAYLHSAKPAPILHRDLKSANILLDSHGNVKVSDFGLARVKAQAWSTSVAAMTGGIGTFQWMAPEVLGNQPYTESADVYSYGIILWEMMARQVPFAHEAAGGAAGRGDGQGAPGQGQDGQANHMNQMQVALQVMNHGLRPSLDLIPGHGHVAPPYLSPPGSPQGTTTSPRHGHGAMTSPSKGRAGPVSSNTGYGPGSPGRSSMYNMCIYPRELIELMTACWAQAPSARPSFLELVRRMEDMASRGS